MKVLFINKILLSIEIIPVVLLLCLALILAMGSSSFFFLIITLSILSLISLIYIMVKTILGRAENIESRFVYLLHIGFFITMVGMLSPLLDYSSPSNSNPKLGIFTFGIVACIPYFHIVVLNKYWLWSSKKT